MRKSNWVYACTSDHIRRHTWKLGRRSRFSNHGRPCVTIKAKLCGTCSLRGNLSSGNIQEKIERATLPPHHTTGLHKYSDPEIRGAQRELQPLCKKRKLVTIQAKIEEERRLLVQQTSNACTTETRGQKCQKRRRINSISYDRTQSRTAIANKYRGKGIREFTMFMTFIGNTSGAILPRINARLLKECRKHRGIFSSGTWWCFVQCSTQFIQLNSMLQLNWIEA